MSRASFSLKVFFEHLRDESGERHAARSIIRDYVHFRFTNHPDQAIVARAIIKHMEDVGIDRPTACVYFEEMRSEGVISGNEYDGYLLKADSPKSESPESESLTTPPAGSKGVKGVKEIKSSEDFFDSVGAFREAWEHYPRKYGRPQAERAFLESVNSAADYAQFNKALANHLTNRQPQYVQHGGRFFSEWREWINDPETPPVNATLMAKNAAALRQIKSLFGNENEPQPGE
jgi:hypothetical protein